MVNIDTVYEKMVTKYADFDRDKYSGYNIGFDARGSFSLSNSSEKVVIIFGTYMTSSVHNDNKNKDILVLAKGRTDVIDETTLTAEKEYSINFTNQQKKFYWSLHYNGVNSYIFFNCVEIYKFKTKYSEKNAASVSSDNVSKEFLIEKMKKTELCGYV